MSSPATTEDAFDLAFGVSTPAPIVPVDENETLAQRKRRQLRDIEDEILAESSDVVLGIAKFARLDPSEVDENGEPNREPPEWLVNECGGDVERARAMMRVALYANLPSKDAPAGLKLALTAYVGITKSRSGERAAPKALNVAFIVKNENSHHYHEAELEE